MSRRRSSDPAIPVSISVPRSLHTRLNELLSYKQSRSAWICGAMLAKFKSFDVLQQIQSKELVHELYGREIIDYAELRLYLNRIKSMKQVEETVEEQ